MDKQISSADWSYLPQLVQNCRYLCPHFWLQSDNCAYWLNCGLRCLPFAGTALVLVVFQASSSETVPKSVVAGGWWCDDRESAADGGCCESLDVSIASDGDSPLWREPLSWWLTACCRYSCIYSPSPITYHHYRIITGFQLENNILNTLVQSNNLDNPCLTPVSQAVITVKDK